MRRCGATVGWRGLWLGLAAYTAACALLLARRVPAPSFGGNVGSLLQSNDTLSARIEEEADMHVVGATGKIAAALVIIRTTQPMVVLLDYLLAAGHKPEFTCRFRWEKGSVAFWDNHAVKHLAIHDAGPYLRLMRRVQIAGDKPYE